MLDTILSWISDILGELVDAVISMFLGCFTCDLSTIASMFPFFVIGYRIFQAIGLGLILCISVFELLQFFAPGGRNITDTPVGLVVRAAIAAFMLYFGNYFLEILLNLARYPFETMVAANGAVFPFGFAGLGVEDLLLSGAVGGSTMILFGIIIMLLIGWNIIKLMIEIMERYVMIGVLAFSAPLIYPTITSSSTMSIFRKWLGMFAGQCMIMTISAWLLKVIISGFEMNAASGTSSFFQLIAVLAMCKIAQRADNYMQQLGIGVATTGGNLLDEVVGVAMAAQRLTGGHRGANTKDVLGADANGNLNRSRFGGVLGGMSNSIQGAYQRWKQGESAASVAHHVGEDFKTGTGFTFGTTVKEGAAGMKRGFTNLRNDPVQGGAEMVKGMGQMAFGTYASVGASGPAINSYRKMSAERQASMDVGGTGEASGSWRNGVYREAYRGARQFNQEASRYGNVYGTDGVSLNADTVGDDVRDRAHDMGVTAQQYMDYHREKFGAGGIQDGELDETATSIGMSWDNNPDSYLLGSNEKIGDFGAANYADLGLSENADMNEALCHTIQEGDAAIAEQMLFNPTAELRGNDALGDTLMKKAFDEKTLTGHSGGTFSNIHAAASDPDGGRRITADYTYMDREGRTITKPMEIASDNYLAHHIGSGEGNYRVAEQMAMGGIRSEATGEQFWVKGQSDQGATVQEPYYYQRSSGGGSPAAGAALPGSVDPHVSGTYEPLTQQELQTAKDNISGRGYAGDVSLAGSDTAPRYEGKAEHVASYLAEGAGKMKDSPAEQTAAINTVRASSPEFSRQILNTLTEDGSPEIRKMELQGNDELATEVLKRAYGDQLPESMDGYHNVKKVQTPSGETAIQFQSTEQLPGGMRGQRTYYVTQPQRSAVGSGRRMEPMSGTVSSQSPMREYKDESGQSFFVADYPVRMQEVAVPNAAPRGKGSRKRPWNRKK